MITKFFDGMTRYNLHQNSTNVERDIMTHAIAAYGFVIAVGEQDSVTLSWSELADKMVELYDAPAVCFLADQLRKIYKRYFQPDSTTVPLRD